MRRGSWTLVEMVVCLAIMAALAAWLVPRYLGKSAPSASGKTVTAPIERAQGVECMSNLRQIRSAIQMAQASNETAPRSLAELTSAGVPQSMLYCPVFRQAYRYDPASGRVGCPAPEHQSY